MKEARKQANKSGIHVSYEGDIGTNDTDYSQGMGLKLFAFFHSWHGFCLIAAINVHILLVLSYICF
jgi:hypothetical protein